MKQIKIVQLLILFVFVPFFLLFSCKKIDDSGSIPYNPNKHVTLDAFTPTEGGMATRVVLSGQNLGNDPSKLKVYFNDKKAAIIGCDKGRALVVTPRQPGEECTISVVIGKDSVTYNTKFAYHISTTVTTLVGIKGSTEFIPGPFSTASFVNPIYLTVDKDKNLFVSQWNVPGNGNVIMVSQEKKEVTLLAQTGYTNAPSADLDGKVIYFPHDANVIYYTFDPDELWAPRRRTILHPSADDIANGMVDFTCNGKHCFAQCKLDKMIYTRSYEGVLLKFNPQTRIGQLVQNDIMPNSDGFLVFDPKNPEILYLAYRHKHCIYTYNIKTNEHKLFAGTLGVAGWRDGRKEDALFNQPRQMLFDINDNLIIADSNNHCIRKITPDGMVSTIIGIAGKAGYQDGNPDDALFNMPTGVAIDSNYDIYVADYNNNCIRKLSVE